MAFFKSNRSRGAIHSFAPPVVAWTPTIDLAAARQPLLDAIHATNSNGRLSNDQVEPIIKRLLVLGGAPRTDHEAARYLNDPEHRNRPWVWLAANTRNAHANGDHEFVAYSSFWAHMWKNVLFPKFGAYEWITYFTAGVPPEVASEIAALAESSLAQMPREHVLFGDDTGTITAGAWRDTVSQLLT